MRENGKTKGGKAWVPLLLAFSLSLFASAADACTGMYAGRKVTTDGSVLIGRTVDFEPYSAAMVQQICEAGTLVAFNGVTNKYRYVCAPKATCLRAGRYAGSAANEKGVILTGTITGATRKEALENDSFVPEGTGGVGEPSLPDYVIGTAATAGGWGVATNGVIEVPVSGSQGFCILKSNPAVPNAGMNQK